MEELPILWRPENIYPARGWWRTSRESACYRWEAAAYFAGRSERATAMMVGCWNTIGECLQANRLEITGDHPKEVYPLTFAGKLRELSLNQDHTDFTNSDECVAETIIANEYEFTADGERV